MTILSSIQSELHSHSSPVKAKNSAWFFKTGPGQYGEGDVFIGVTLPEQRAIAKKYYKDATSEDIVTLLNDKIHEFRLTALIIMTYKYDKSTDDIDKRKMYALYLKHIDRVNNWDLVDLSAYKIVGRFLADRDKSLLKIFARSKNMWHRRIAIISTFHYIKQGDAADALRISEMLIYDKEELIHKAVGWMLREVGKRVSQKEEEEFLDAYAATMPRTALRYAIERFDDSKKKHYLMLKNKAS